MLRSIRKPLLSSDDMSNFHFPVINDICEVKCWPAILFNNNKIVKFRSFHFSINLILKIFFIYRGNIWFNSNCIWMSFFNFLFHFIRRKLSATATIPMLTLSHCIFLLSFDIVTKARICVLLLKKSIFNLFVKGQPFTLNIWSKLYILLFN